MDRDAKQIYCPNTSCHAPNPERSKFCQRCRTLLPKRYLWAIETEGETMPLPNTLEDRYVHCGDRVYLDTHPGLLPRVPEAVPDDIRAYLKLFAYRWNVPQIYGAADWPSATGRTIWLLENAPIERRPDGHWRTFPHITHAWADPDTDDLQRVGWIWQMVNLWDACLREGVASTLLDPQHIRIEGSFLRLGQLIPDEGKSPTFKKLGHLWSRWIPATRSLPIYGFFAALCKFVIDERIRTSYQVKTSIDRVIDRLQSTREYRWEVATLSDRGPSRTRNEDACFPIGEQPATSAPVLSIVCDGVGGHDGGDIASSLAIETMAAQIGTGRTSPVPLSRTEKIERVHAAIALANDTVGERNNLEHRQGRQRMGTTLVMGQGEQNDLFVSHVGDSRAYLVNRNAFYSLTVDDDVASREVRLGYAFYRAAVHQPTAGSLVQALGMSASANLYPTIQRFILNEDSVILLCSDGLSDYDRVEQHWQSELQPLLDSTISLSGAAHRLIEIANTQNGHDNVTVSLMRLRVTPVEGRSIDPTDLATCLMPIPHAPGGDDDEAEDDDLDYDDRGYPDDDEAIQTEQEADTQLVVPRRARRSRKKLVLATAIPLTLAIGVAAWLARGGPGFQLAFDRADSPATLPLGEPTDPSVSDSDVAALPTDAPLVPPPIAPLPSAADAFAIGQRLAIRKSISLRRDKYDSAPMLDRPVLAGAIVEVTSIYKTVDRHWLRLQFCPPAPGSATTVENVTTDNVIATSDSPTAEAAQGEPETTPTSIPTPQATPTMSVTASQAGDNNGWLDTANLQAEDYEIYETPPGQAWSCAAASSPVSPAPAP